VPDVEKSFSLLLPPWVVEARLQPKDCNCRVSSLRSESGRASLWCAMWRYQ